MSTTVAPKGIREDNELLGNQFVVRGDLPTTTERVVRVEQSRSTGHHRRVRAGKKTSKFRMKVSAEESCVVGGLGNNVRHKIRRSGVGVVIELRANRGEL